MPRILPIAKRGDPILQQRAQPVADIHDPAVQALLDDLLLTLEVSNGVGIAAPQVFVSLRIIIVASRPNPRYPDAPLMQPLAMLNPEILWQSAATCTGWEGCLSVPDTRAQVIRATRLHIHYLDRQGAVVEAAFDGFIARTIQHECDHLDGILFPERLPAQTPILTEAEFQQAIRGSAPEPVLKQ